jgi:pSer/pThr/pTyr-binding forkhead associated (FHA) protein
MRGRRDHAAGVSAAGGVATSTSPPARWRVALEAGTITVMARCALCSLPATMGHLCDGHRKAILSPGLTSEQLSSRRADGAAALIDPWGTAWPIGDPMIVGRSLDACDLTVLHSSISLVHAEIARSGDTWRLTDRDSRNGTFVDGARIASSVTLADGARIRFGEIAMFFCERSMPRADQPTGPGRTAPSRKDQLIFSASLRSAGGERVELSQRVEGGVVRVAGAAVDLGRLEFRLLQVLTEARRESPDPDQAYLSWSRVADQLDFRSYDADSENVRELVRRVRRKLQQAGIDELIESKHGVGYRISAAYVTEDPPGA